MPAVKTKDFADQCQFPYINATETIDGNGRKHVTGFESGWMKWDFDKCQQWNETHPGNMIAINLSKTNYMVIDIDKQESVESTLKNYLADDGSWQTKSSRRGLPHLYRLRDPEDPCNTDIDRDGTGVDYIYKQIWEDPNGFINIPTGETEPPLFEAFSPVVAKVVKVKSDVPKSNTPEDVKFKTLMLDNITVEHWANRESWKRLLYAMRSEEISEQVMEQYSRKANNYEDGCVQDLLADWDEDKSTSWGTVEHFSRLSNSEAHAAICANRPRSVSTTSSVSNSKHEISTDKFLALKALELTNGEIVKVGDLLYVYEQKKGYWRQDHKGSHSRVMISNLVDEWLLEGLESLKGMSDAAKPYNKARDKVSSNSGINNVYSIFKDIIPENEEIEFDDMRPYYFVWSCGKAYDFASHDFVVLKKEDYVTMTTGYPYETYTEPDLVSLQKLYREIHFDEDTYLPYMSMCVTACIGIQVEKLIVNTGSGGNGKGLVNELLAKMLGKYFYKGSVSTLQEPIKAEQANPALASMHLKRLTICTEPEPGKKLNQATLKTITGDGDINARQLYSSTMKVNNQNTLVMECNQLPNISGKMDNSVKRRIRAIPFNATYTDDPNDPDLVAGKPHVYAANLLYKQALWQNSKRAALFEMIRMFAKEHGTELLESETCKKSAAAYVKQSDFAMVWFEDLYERVEDDTDVEPLPMIELFKDFKECDEYKNMDREDKKYWTKRQLIEQLTEKLHKDDYHECKVWNASKKRYRSAIWNWRLIPEDY